ncbi:PaaI family thioesterase [Luteithermobacter gelatinilyticus]|uniref:PaaI family thioesterase n=1 Tax=Luteithermobacter gelatinilyticus TaxID=2582913 RepID=UPI001105813D|nr:PaaI family thioesterase [Luteithermobacter gelatinilyticus]|tara:strand:- start:19791 stop:20276 length:486 start_codon:yes stop_codon:yes gene_type:complete
MTRPKEGGETISAQNIELTQLILHIPHARKLGLKLVDCAEDSLIVELPYSSQIEARPGSGVIANGAITTLLDTAFGAAVFNQFTEIRQLATLDLRVDFMSAAKPFSPVFAKVSCRRITREVVFVRGDAYCDDPDMPIAHATGAFSHADLPREILSHMGQNI